MERPVLLGLKVDQFGPVEHRDGEQHRLDQGQAAHLVGMLHRQPQRHGRAEGVAHHVHAVRQVPGHRLGHAVAEIAAPVPVRAAPVAQHVGAVEGRLLLQLRRHAAPRAGMGNGAVEGEHLPRALAEAAAEERLRHLHLAVHRPASCRWLSRSSIRSCPKKRWSSPVM